MKMKTNKKVYSFKKTLLKGLEVFLMGGVSYLLVYLSNIPEKPGYVLMILGIIKMLHNYLKNRNK